MKSGSFVRALALGAALVPAAALADDPHDKTMRDAAARARDSAAIRQLNQQQLDHVRKRDARNWQAMRDANDNARAEYARKMAAWRHAVAACNAGQREYCDN